MGRKARLVAVGVAHHVTQRGVDQQAVFCSDADHLHYLELLRKHSAREELDVVGYCLMTNHVHLVVVPWKQQSMARTLARVQGQYAQRWNVLQERSGHLWQNRYYSCPTDRNHLWAALRYVEMNPVRAGMVEQAWHWPWSSAGTHSGAMPDGGIPLAMGWWRARFNEARWKDFLDKGTAAEETEMRQFTRNGWALGEERFVTDLELRLGRPVRPRKGGRPGKQTLKHRRQAYLCAAE